MDTQKIVINKCFGGFGLSPLACKRLAELQGRECYNFTSSFVGSGSSYKQVGFDDTSIFTMCFDIPNPNDFDSNDNDWWSEHHIDSSPDDRTDPLLVQVVEELGDKANARYSNLQIIEIPVGVEYVIDEYDGQESVHEAHRSW